MESFFAQCQIDSYQTDFVTKVLSVAPHVVAGGKGKGKDKKQQQGQLYEIVLEDTILFAEGGGQPADSGTLNGVPVKDVIAGKNESERGSQKNAIHVVEIGKEQKIEELFEVGKEVAVHVDWARRFDAMQQHTMQHVITAITEKRLGRKTVGWGVYAEHSVVELEGAPFNAEQIQLIETEVNDAIRDARPVVTGVYTEETLPEDIRSRGAVPRDGAIRVVSVVDVDSCTCCGTHVKNTAHLQMMKFNGIERSRAGSFRVVFLAGNRVMQLFTKCLEWNRDLGKIYSCAPDKFATQAKSMIEEVSNANKQKKKFMHEMAVIDAKPLIEEGKTAPVVCFHRSGVAMEYLDVLLGVISDAGAEGPMYVLSSGDDENGSLLMLGPADKIKQAGTLAKSLLGAKGGGKPGKFAGKIEKLDKIAEFQESVKAF